MIKIEQRQIFSDEGRLVHRLGTDSYFSRGTAIDGDVPENFEEVDTAPAADDSRARYKEEVKRLIRQRYDVDDELAMHRKMQALQLPAVAADEAAAVYADALMHEFADYHAYVEQCKEQARRISEDVKSEG